ncbi:unnamed protein product [marine sediment metagenome]|uniref:Uncharacterized protein n=1 Tax=marine sediment metagenome TaxID=412755 RepID=X1HJI6_9ZZZZ
MSKKEKYIVIFLIKQQELYKEVSRKKVNKSIKKIRYNKKKLYPINTSIPSFSKGLKSFFFMDINKGQLFFNENAKNPILDPILLDDIVSKSIIKQLTMNLSDTAFKMNMTLIFVGLVIGGLIGWIAGGFG